MEELNIRVNELVDKLNTELDTIRERAAKAAELPEELKGIKDQAKEACGGLETVAAGLKEATEKFGAIMQTLTEAQKVIKGTESRIMEAIVEANRRTKEAGNETKKAIKGMESKFMEKIEETGRSTVRTIHRITIMAGILLIIVAMAGVAAITWGGVTGDAGVAVQEKFFW